MAGVNAEDTRPPEGTSSAENSDRSGGSPSLGAATPRTTTTTQRSLLSNFSAPDESGADRNSGNASDGSTLRLNPALRKKMKWNLTKTPQNIDLGPGMACATDAHDDTPTRIVKPLKEEQQNPYSLFHTTFHSSGDSQSNRTSQSGANLNSSKVSSVGQDTSSSSTLSFDNAFLRDREKAKRPTRDIAMWIPVTLYILNDVLNGTFTLIPYIMGFNGWIAGIAVIWMMGLVGYYTSNLLYRMSIVFPGAVSMGDLSYYLNRSVFGMTVTFILAYLLMFLTSSQQLSMAASMFQYVAAGGKYIIYLPAWLVIMVLVLIPLSQVRTLRSVFFFNIFNVTAVLIFWGIAMGVNLYKIIVIGNEAGIPTKLFPPVEDVQFWNNTRYDNIQIGFPLGGVMIAFQMFYYQLS